MFCDAVAVLLYELVSEHDCQLCEFQTFCYRNFRYPLWIHENTLYSKIRNSKNYPHFTLHHLQDSVSKGPKVAHAFT